MAALPYPAYKINVGRMSAAPSGNADSQHSLGFICTDGD
ncbi:hypothetical protein LTSEADE_3526 [Salmonella enterica subsp. enterica serovar Adelaide str. A4-669]|uniref:Uncharacterized protein n=1 Tax=Salmonella enterica subsp. enterica serovar Adelaide str. A4-669 TaxID=913063 RepID=A0A6C8GKN7_SALET|nr:hypothetical protein LTSEADE_3526 [Salmonella enterica subsp. enterica serovar Adelaide str. A4-669]